MKYGREEYYSKSNNTITVHIRHLREKNEGYRRKAQIYKNGMGVGYKIEKFRKTNTDYTKLNRIIFFRGLGIMLGAVSAVLLLRAMTRGHLADTIVLWIARIFP